MKIHAIATLQHNHQPPSTIVKPGDKPATAEPVHSTAPEISSGLPAGKTGIATLLLETALPGGMLTSLDQLGDLSRLSQDETKADSDDHLDQDRNEQSPQAR